MFVRTTVAHPRYEFLAGRLEGADVGLSPLVAARSGPAGAGLAEPSARWPRMQCRWKTPRNWGAAIDFQDHAGRRREFGHRMFGVGLAPMPACRSIPAWASLQAVKRSTARAAVGCPGQSSRLASTPACQGCGCSSSESPGSVGGLTMPPSPGTFHRLMF